MAEISSSAAAAAPLSPPHEPPAAEGHGGGGFAAAADDDDDNGDSNTFSPLLDLLERFPDLFAQKVLQHVDPIDRTFLAQAGGSCRAAMAASDLPRAGTRLGVLEKRVWVVTHKITEFYVRRAAGLGQGERLPVGHDDMHARRAAEGGRL